MKTYILAVLALLLVCGCTQPTTPDQPIQENAILPVALPAPDTIIVDHPPVVPFQENETPSTNEEILPSTVGGISSITVTKTPVLKWTGGYADASVIEFDGKYWMYLNQFGNGKKTGVFVLSSTDGLEWKNETDVIFDGIATVRALVIGEKVYAYYPQGGAQIGPNDPAAIVGSVSSDAKKFSSVSKIKISPHDGYTMDGPGVFQLPDGTYRMYFTEFDRSDIPKREGKMWGASSPDGITWTKDDAYTLEPEANVEGLQPWPQILHPFITTYHDGFLMLYNSHSTGYWAYSPDGFSWEKGGKVLNNNVPLHGADIDGFWINENELRIYYGDFSPQTGGVIYTTTLRVNTV